ncbi:MAG: hypothetical protein PHE82_07195 [Syntrophomonadaceae bacterium]|nr:hypothetical protein [Syntrophomonadaceae bacterium]
MRMIPDFQIELTQATDYILDSKLARHALKEPPFLGFGNIIRDTMEDIDRLADNCHLPEFTDHALPHLCSMIKRISDWGWEGNEENKWGEKLGANEAAYLLLAILIHDIGMLSQDPAHLEIPAMINLPKGLADVSNWVRTTHVRRMKKLYEQLLKDRGYEDFSNSSDFDFIIALGCAHENWPWQERYKQVETYAQKLVSVIKPSRAKGLAAVLAVADLLDEDANRCDTATLIKHRQGTTLNKAHWIRHALTEYVEIKQRKLFVKFVKPPRDWGRNGTSV